MSGPRAALSWVAEKGRDLESSLVVGSVSKHSQLSLSEGMLEYIRASLDPERAQLTSKGSQALHVALEKASSSHVAWRWVFSKVE